MIPIRDTIPARNPPIATWTLIIVNALAFLLELTMAPPELDYFARLFGIVPARYMHAEWASAVGLSPSTYWPFLTSMFLHGSGLHLLGNMWTLWIFGDNVEDRLGRIPFALFYLVTGIIGSVVQIVAAPESRVPVVGASGAISGVLGAYIVMFPRKRVRVLLFYFIMEVPALVVLGLWALTQLLNGAGSLTGGGAEEGGVAYLAHVGGFASGVLGALIWRAISPGPRPRGRLPFDY